MSKKFFVMLLAGAVLFTACGNINSGQEKIAVVDMKKIVSVHPDYAKLQQGEKMLLDLKQKRADQAELAKTQLESLAKLEELKRISERTYLTADYNTRMYAAEVKEAAKLQQVRKQVESDAESLIADRKENIEDSYRLKMFNLRLQLDSVRMSKDKKQALKDELALERGNREEKIYALEAEKAAYVKANMEPHRQLMQNNLQQESARLQEKISVQLQQSEDKYSQLYEKASPALKNMLNIMDKEISRQQSRNEAVRRQIDTDIEKTVKQLAKKNQYSIVFKDVRTNIQAEDITEQVINGLKNN